jgi:serine/threonine protein kinase
LAIIITEWLDRGSLDGPLYDLNKSRNLTPTARAKIVVGIVLAMRFMHACGIAHRDLKPANILLDGKYEMRIGDLGSSRRIDLHQTQGVGMVHYVTLEIFSESTDEPYDEKVDIFSFAIILWEIVSGQRAYAAYASLLHLPFMTKVINGLRPDMVPMKR